MATLPKGQGILLPPFKAWLASNIPAVYDNTMTYYEELCALIKYLQDIVVPAVNENAAAVTVISNAVEQLQKYVEDYFTNLDVQEEINNKLDQMAENGTLQEIITTYIQANVAWTFDTVADMKQATNLVNGSYARTLGFNTINDGGGALYKITNTGTANEMDIIAVGTLFANLILDNELSIKQLGAYGDNIHDDTDAIKRALTLSDLIFIPNGHYKITDNLSFSRKHIKGEGQFVSYIHPTDITGTVITLSGDQNKFEDFSIHSDAFDYSVKGTTNTNTCLDISTSHHNTFENIRIVGFDVGIYARNAWCQTFNSIQILNCNTGLNGYEEFNNIGFYRCNFNYCLTAVIVNYGYGVEFNACDIERNTKGVQCMNDSDVKLSSCYFEYNSEGSIIIPWNNTWVKNVQIDNCSFFENADCQGVIHYHSNAAAYIIVSNCTFRANNNIADNTVKVFVKLDNASQAIPFVESCTKYSCFYWNVTPHFVDLVPKAISASDWITLESGFTIDDFALFEQSGHVFGELTITKDSAYTNASTTIGVLKDPYKPKTNVNTYAVLSGNRWQQTTDKLCYLYISGTSIATHNGDGTSTVLKAMIDYVKK